MSVNRIDSTLTDDQRDRANTALAVLAEAVPFLIALGRRFARKSNKAAPPV